MNWRNDREYEVNKPKIKVVGASGSCCTIKEIGKEMSGYVRAFLPLKNNLMQLGKKSPTLGGGMILLKQRVRSEPNKCNAIDTHCKALTDNKTSVKIVASRVAPGHNIF